MKISSAIYKRIAVTAVLATSGLAGFGASAASAACGPDMESVGASFIKWGEAARQAFGQDPSKMPSVIEPMIGKFFTLTTAASVDEITPERISQACYILDDLYYLVDVKGRDGLNAIFKNDTKYDALQLKVSATEDYSQAQNLLGDEPLLPGQSIAIYLSDDTSNCNWTVFWDAKEVGYSHSVDLCKETMSLFQTMEESEEPATANTDSQDTKLQYVYSLSTVCGGDIFEGQDTMSMDIQDQTKAILAALSGNASGIECATLGKDNEFSYFEKASGDQYIYRADFSCKLESTQSVTLETVGTLCAASGFSSEYVF